MKDELLDEFEPLLIAGASARAAAMSAARGGMRVRGCDLFGDIDLRRIADVTVVDNLQADLLAAAQRMPAGFWMYTGALENHRRVVETISQRHHLLGNPGDVLRRVRDPFRIGEQLQMAGLVTLDVRRSDDPPPRDGDWLIKPLRSAAGRRIAIWDDSPETLNEPHYFQERFVGTPIAAVFLAGRLSCRMLGVTRQLVGESDLQAGPFAYCGSIGPLPLTTGLRSQVEAIGRRLVDESALRGLFGLDLLIDRDNVRLVEVNPRYPASAEVIEFATGLPMVPLHCLACASFAGDSNAPTVKYEQAIADVVSMSKPIATNSIVGKAILFAGRDVIAPAINSGSGSMPPIADIPAPESRIPKGAPICTLIDTGENVVQCLNQLIHRAREMQAMLPGNSG